jgi:ribose transport system ATP-binding protein
VTSVGLSVRHVTKTFGSTLALDDVSLHVGAGRVHGLLGSNGSGKSTLVKILAGVYQATDGGDVTVGESSAASTSIRPADSAALGMRFVHQQLGLFPQLSIADNFAAAAGYGTGALSTIDRSELLRRTREMMEQFRIDADPNDAVARLRPSVRTLVAIGRVMADRDQAKVLVLDEPTEALPEDETARLLASIKELAAGGMTFVIVSHRLAEIAEVADDVTVLRDGVVAASGAVGSMSRGDLVEHITGKRPVPVERAPRVPVGTVPTVEVKRLAVGSVRDLSFQVMPGEVLGIAGLVGSGRSAVLEGIFGARSLRSGDLALSGRPRRFSHPADAIGAGVAFVPENRVVQGLFLDQPVARNITAVTLRRFFRRGSIDKASERAHGITRIRAMGVKAASPDAAISTLSGGNQQKAIIARWLDTGPTLLLLDEPTQGVDVGARVEIHAIIRSAVVEGMAVILVSSDLDELCDVSDRVMVLRRGRMTHMADTDLTVGRIAAYMHEAG